MKNTKGMFWILGTIAICLLFLVALFCLGKRQSTKEDQIEDKKELQTNTKKEIPKESDLAKAKFEIGSEILYQDGYFLVQSPTVQFLYTENGKKLEQTDATIEILYDQYYILKKDGEAILKRNGKEIAPINDTFTLHKDTEKSLYVASSSLKLDDTFAVSINENDCKTCFSIIYDYKTGESRKEFQGELLKIEFPSKKDTYYAVRNKNITLLKNTLEELGTYSDIQLEKKDTNYQNISDEYFLVSKNNKWGLIDTEGSEKIPTVYESLQYKTNKKDWIVAKKSGKYGVIDVDNEIIFPFSYTRVEIFTHYLLLQDPKKIQILDLEKNVIYEKETEESLSIVETKDNLILEWNKEKESLDEKRVTFIYENKEVKEIEGVSIHYDTTMLNYFIVPKISSSVITGFQIYNSDLEYVGLYATSLTKKDYYEVSFFSNIMIIKLRDTEGDIYKAISLKKEPKELYTSNLPIYKVGNYFVIYNKQIELYSSDFSLQEKIPGIEFKQIKDNCYQVKEDTEVYIYQK